MSDVDMSFEYDDEDDDQSEFSYDEYSDYEDHNATDKNFRSQNTTPDDLNMDSNKLASFKKWTSGDFIDGVFLQAAIDLKNLQLPQCDLDDLLIMLQYCKWQPDEVINNFYDNFDKFINDCGLVKQKNNQMLIKDDYMCFICCEEYRSTKTFLLSCGHEYCVNCYGHYVLNQVSAGHLIKCMDSSCNLTIPHVIVQELIDLTLSEHEINDNSLSLKNSHFNSQNGAYPVPLSLANNALLVSAARLYIDSKSFKFKRCPAPDCDNLIELVENYRLQLDNDPNPEFEFNGDDIDIEQKGNDNADKLDDTSSTTEIHKKSKVDKTSTIRSTRSKSKANKKSQPKKLDEKLDNKRSDDKKVVDISLIPIVSCINEHQFCYNCQYENHLPCPCHLVKAWIKKCKDDSETANWIEANTHSCPKCLASIEKNGGCNHMTCSTCRFEFCWICLREWKIHGSQYYKCNNFDATEKEMIEMNKKQKGISLQRYLHYYKRFSVHESSMKGDLKTLEKINQRMESYMSEQLKHNLANLSWTDVQFLKDAFKALTNGRKTLKWSYCCGFYLKELIFAEVFEQAQEHLNRVVEDLSKIVEEINDKKNNDRSTELIMKNKQDIITLTTAVMKGQHSLIDCAETGLKEKRLEFEPSL